jgi:hypothetical protein
LVFHFRRAPGRNRSGLSCLYALIRALFAGWLMMRLQPLNCVKVFTGYNRLWISDHQNEKLELYTRYSDGMIGKAEYARLQLNHGCRYLFWVSSRHVATFFIHALNISPSRPWLKPTTQNLYTAFHQMFLFWSLIIH